MSKISSSTLWRRGLSLRDPIRPRRAAAYRAASAPAAGGPRSAPPVYNESSRAS